jgi:hypothetical protein
MFKPVSTSIYSLPLVAPPGPLQGNPKRKSLIRPLDNGTFVLPLKQSFIKDARIMPGTARMLALLTGWIGNQERPVIETTKGILARHLQRGSRQIYRYLQDAMEEGYLLYSLTKNRLGMITGIKIWLNSLAIRKKTTFKKQKNAGKPARTLKSDTNEKLYIKKEEDPDLWKILDRFAQSAGFEMPPETPN